MVVWKSAGNKRSRLCRPGPKRGQIGHHVEQTQDSSVKGLNKRVHEAEGKGGWDATGHPGSWENSLPRARVESRYFHIKTERVDD